MKKKKVKRRHLHSSHHHVVPVSRGGNGEHYNLTKVDQRKHQLYHALFENKKPNEIISYLVETFWNNQWHWVYQCLLRDERRLPDEIV